MLRTLLSRKRGVAVGAALTLLLTATACSSGGAAPKGDTGADFTPPERVTALVHTAAGGGADLLARQIIAMMEKEKIIKPGSWTVENREGGGGAVVLSYLREQSARSDIVAFSSNVYFANKLITKDVNVGYGDFTPIVSLYDDVMAVAVAADGLYKTLTEFIDAAKASPGKLVQSGGSLSGTDALSGYALQEVTGAKWQFLSFPGGGDRRTALLRGDSQLYMTEPADMEEYVKSGDMIPVAIMGGERVSIFPDTPSTEELGYGLGAPAQTRGVVGPPKMSAEAITYYEGLFKKLTETDSWKDFIEASVATPTFRTSKEFDAHMKQQVEDHIEIFRKSGLLVNG